MSVVRVKDGGLAFDQRMEEILVWPGQADFLQASAKKIGLFTGAGYGKCFRKDTEILMASGEVRKVQDIVIGDRVAGLTGTRIVQNTARGFGQMFEVRPVKGESHFVNADHILTLVCSGTKEFSKWKDGDLRDVPVREWLTWGPAMKKRWKLFKVGLDFEGNKAPIEVDPYVFGLLLGDGNITQTVGFTTMSPVLVEAFKTEAARFGLHVTTSGEDRTAPTYYAVGTAGKTNPLTTALRKLRIFGKTSADKFIPFEYKTGSREVRQQILAGLMDTDGSVNLNCYDYVSKSKQLADDVVFIARSLGISATINQCVKSCQTGAAGTYWRVSLSDVSQIPSRIKPVPERRQIKNPLRTGFDIIPLGNEEYYGFALDGDARFLLADFTVTHNSKVLVMRALMDHAKQDGWWEGRLDYDENPLVMVMAAPNSAYLTRRTVPEFRGTLASWEEKIGRQLTKPTGRARNGWFDSKDERRCEMANGVKFLFYGMHDEKAAVASDIIALYMDEATMLENEQIYSRAKNRVRDSRGMDGFLLVACVGTPEKGHFMYDEFYDPDTDIPRAGVQVFADTSLNNPTLTWKFCDDMVGNSEAYIEMQAMGKWVKGIGGQRFAHLFEEERHLKVLDWPVDYPGIKYDIGWDPGWSTGSVIVAYHHPQKNIWCIYDEIVIQGMNTEDAAKELLKRGYNWNNIRYIGMDPRDASKHRSSGKHTDADIVFKVLRVRPHYKDVRGYNAVLRLRLEALEELLKNDRIVFNKRLKPTNRKKGGIINGIKNFALEAIKDMDEKFEDKPDAATIKYWKHPIDALHYILMEYEHNTYGKAVRDFKADKLAAKTFGGFKKYSRHTRRS